MTRDPMQMAAAGFVSGALLTSAADLDDVLPMTNIVGDFTGEVRFRFAGRWWTVTPAPVGASDG